MLRWELRVRRVIMEMLGVGAEGAWGGSGGCRGSRVRDADANGNPRENLSTLCCCAGTAQINGGPSAVAWKCQAESPCPIPTGLSLSRPPPPPPLHQMPSSGRPSWQWPWSSVRVPIALNHVTQPREGTWYTAHGCSSRVQRGQLCTNRLQTLIYIFFFFLPFWLRSQPCPT